MRRLPWPCRAVARLASRPQAAFPSSFAARGADDIPEAVTCPLAPYVSGSAARRTKRNPNKSGKSAPLTLVRAPRLPGWAGLWSAATWRGTGQPAPAGRDFDGRGGRDGPRAPYDREGRARRRIWKARPNLSMSSSDQRERSRAIAARCSGALGGAKRGRLAAGRCTFSSWSPRETGKQL